MKIITVMAVLLLISNISYSKEIRDREYISLEMKVAIGDAVTAKQEELISELREKIKSLEEENQFYKNLSEKMWRKEHR